MLRLTPLLVLLALVPSACDSAATPAASRGAALRPDLRGATARTLGARSAFFTMTAAIGFQGVPVHTESRGRVSFTSRRAHVYKLVPGDPVPHEEIVDGPLVYANANITAALSDPTQKGWTKLDTRRISADRRLGELDHVRTAVYLPSGALDVHRLGQRDGLVRFRARVAPTRVLAHVPAAERSRVRAILRADYPAAPFAADFWLDGKGRLRRVRVSYRTEKGSTFTLVLRFGSFGAPVDVTPPSAEGTQDITP